MALTTVITGRVALPTDQPAKAAELVFTLTGWDKAGADIFPPAKVRSVMLLADGTIPAGFKLWRNSSGENATTYNVALRWSEADRRGAAEPREASLGQIYIAGAGPFTLAALLPTPVTVPTPPGVLAQAAGFAASAGADAGRAEDAANRIDLGALDDAVEASGGNAAVTSADRIATSLDRAAAEQAALIAEGEAEAAAAASARTGPNAAAADIARIGAEAARDATIAAGAWDYRPVDDTARAAITGMTSGQTALVQSSMRLWRYSGSAWVDLGISPLAPISDKAGRVDNRSGALSEGFSRRVIVGVSSPITGTNFPGGSQYVHGEAMPGPGVLRRVQLFSAVAAQLTIGIFSRSVTDVFALQKSVTVQTVVGVNNIELDLPFAADAYFGYASPTAGFVTYIAAQNIGYFAGTLVSGSFTDSTTTPTNTVQIGFEVDLFDRQPILNTLAHLATTAQFIGLQAEPAAGTNFPGGTMVIASAASEDSFIEALELRANVAANVRISIYERRGIALHRVRILRRVTVSPVGLNRIELNAELLHGQMIGLQSPGSGWTATVNAAGANPYFYTSDAEAMSFSQAAPATLAAPQIRLVSRRRDFDPVHRISLENCNRLLIIGPSYMAGGLWTLRDKNWPAVLSAAVDFNIDAFGIGGSSMRHMLDGRVRSNQPLPPILAHEKGLRDYSATTALIVMGWNDAFSGVTGVSYAEYLQNSREMIESLRSLGAQVVVAHEWQPAFDRANPVTQIGIELLAREMGVDYINLIPGTLAVRGSSPFYPGFWDSGSEFGTNHPGARAGYILADGIEAAMREVMPATARSLKIFRPRAGYTGRNSLLFGSRHERSRIWREISQQHLAMLDPSKVDAINESADSELVRSEYMALRGGLAIPVSEYALIDTVIDGQIGGVRSVSLLLGDPTLTVYVRDALYSTNPADYPTGAGTVCQWVEVPGDGTGRYRIDAASLPGKLHGDNISFLVYKAGGFSLAAPVVEWRGDGTKPLRPAMPHPSARGAPVLTVTGFTDNALTGWIRGGSPAPSTDASHQFPRGVSRIITLDQGDSISQALNYAPDPEQDREAEIVITARHFPAIGSITPDSFDLSRVLVDLIFASTSGTGRDAERNYVMTQALPVGLWWRECRLRFRVPLIAAPLMLRLRTDRSGMQIARVTARFVHPI